MSTVYEFLADGFEETEAITPLDILRRGGVAVKTVGLPGKTVTGSHGIPVVADIDGSAGFVLPEDAAMVLLPGGPGTAHLKTSETVLAAIKEAAARDIYIAAICAAPTLLAEQGLLAGKKATAFPEYENNINSAGIYTAAPVQVDGKIITSRSMGTAARFGKALLAALTSAEKADAVIHNIYPEEQY